ncbi:MAG: GNAT family N-acetyltransferase [Sporolactobacillus sp.]|uniref:GNAT family N-acetyltransferase n=1 Tax=Sporolactobacillus sp. STSJ-5 TaxID=2965076 RepID=UPI002107666B|nr:GNAT family N-acetyltransferase [Sporolactobacillus sp. STSJ-5]MCQ2011393.1 GNAT family N-acetyltransferase [Sporolactobacillus sp. STSJ-5]
MTIAFRELTKEDIPEFVDMRKLQLLEEGAIPTTDLTKSLTNYFETSLEDGSFVSWIALVDDKIIATSGMSFSRRPPYYENPSGYVGTLSCMHTLSAYRRKGIATKLLNHVIDEARQRHCGKVTITASAMGKLLYKSYGFKQKDNYLDYDLRRTS